MSGSSRIAEITGSFGEISRRVSALQQEKINLIAKLNFSRPKKSSLSAEKLSQENVPPFNDSHKILRDEIESYIASPHSETPNLSKVRTSSAFQPNYAEYLAHEIASLDDGSRTVFPSDEQTQNIRLHDHESAALLHEILKITMAISSNDTEVGAADSKASLKQSAADQKIWRDSTGLQAGNRPPESAPSSQQQREDTALLAKSKSSDSQAGDVCAEELTLASTYSVNVDLLLKAKDLEITSLTSARRQAEERAAVILSELGLSQRSLSEARRENSELTQRLENLSEAKSRDAAALRGAELALARHKEQISKQAMLEEESSRTIRQLQRDLELARRDCHVLADQGNQVKAVECVLSAECRRLEGLLQVSSARNDAERAEIEGLRAKAMELAAQLTAARSEGAALHSALLQEGEERRAESVSFISQKQVLIDVIERNQADLEESSKRYCSLKTQSDMVTAKLCNKEQELDRIRAECVAARQAKASALSFLSDSKCAVAAARNSVLKILMETKIAHHEWAASLLCQTKAMEKSLLASQAKIQQMEGHSDRAKRLFEQQIGNSLQSLTDKNVKTVQMAAENEKLRERIAALEASLSRYIEEFSLLKEASDSEREKLEAELSSRTAELDRLRKQMEIENQRKDCLNEELNKAKCLLEAREQLLEQERAQRFAEEQSNRDEMHRLLHHSNEKLELAEMFTHKISNTLATMIRQISECNDFIPDLQLGIGHFLVGNIENFEKQNKSMKAECDSLKELLAYENLRFENERSASHQNICQLVEKNMLFEVQIDGLRRQNDELSAASLASKRLISESRRLQDQLMISFDEDRKSLISILQSKEAILDELSKKNRQLLYAVEGGNRLIAEIRSNTAEYQSEAGKIEASLLASSDKLQGALQAAEKEMAIIQQNLVDSRSALHLETSKVQILLAEQKANESQVQILAKKLSLLEAVLKKKDEECEKACKVLYHSVLHEEQICSGLNSVMDLFRELSAHFEHPRLVQRGNQTNSTKPNHVLSIRVSNAEGKSLSIDDSEYSNQVDRWNHTVPLSLKLISDLSKKAAELRIIFQDLMSFKEEQEKFIICVERRDFDVSERVNALIVEVKTAVHEIRNLSRNDEVVNLKARLESQLIRISLSRRVTEDLKQQLLELDRDIRHFIISPRLDAFLNFGDSNKVERQNTADKHNLNSSGECQSHRDYKFQVNSKRTVTSATFAPSEILLEHSIENNFQPICQKLERKAAICRNCCRSSKLSTGGSTSSSSSFDATAMHLISTESREFEHPISIESRESDHPSDFTSPLPANNGILMDFDGETCEHSKARNVQLVANQVPSQCASDSAKPRTRLSIADITAAYADHEQRISRKVLWHKVVDLTSERNAAWEKIQQLRTIIDRSKHECLLFNKVSKEKIKLAQDLEELKDRQDDLQKEIQQLKNIIFETKNAELEAQTLKEKLDAKCREIASLKNIEFERGKLQHELCEIKEQNENLKEDLERCRNLGKEKRKIERHYKELADETEDLREEVNQLNNVAADNRNAVCKLKSLKADIEKVRSENYELRRSSMISTQILLNLLQLVDDIKEISRRDSSVTDIIASLLEINKQEPVLKLCCESQNQLTNYTKWAAGQYSMRKEEIQEVSLQAGQDVTSGEDPEDCSGLYLVSANQQRLRIRILDFDGLDPNDSDMIQNFLMSFNATCIRICDSNLNSSAKYKFLLVCRGKNESSQDTQMLEGRREGDFVPRIEIDVKGLFMHLSSLEVKWSSEVEALQFRIASMEQRLKRKDFEMQAAIEHKESQIVQFLRAVESKAAKKDNDLAETRTRLLRAEAALATIVRQRPMPCLSTLRLRTSQHQDNSSDHSDNSP